MESPAQSLFEKLLQAYMYSFCFCTTGSVNQSNTDKETEQNLRVLQSRHQKLVAWLFQHFLVNFVFIQKVFRVYLDLDCQYSNLVTCNLELIWLAIEC